MTQQSLQDRIQALGLDADQLTTVRQSLLLDLAGNYHQCGQVLALVQADAQLQALGLRYVVNPIVWQGWTTLLSYWQALGGEDSTFLQQALRYGYGIPAALREQSDPHAPTVQAWHRALFSGATLDPEQPEQRLALLLNREVLGYIAQAFEDSIPTDTLEPLWAAIGQVTVPRTNPDSPRSTEISPSTSEDEYEDSPNSIPESEVEDESFEEEMESEESSDPALAPNEENPNGLADSPLENPEETENFAAQLEAAALLAAYRLNHFWIADRLRYGFLLETTAEQSGLYLPRFKQLRRLLSIVVLRAKPMGLDLEDLRYAILTGQGNLRRPIRPNDIFDSELLTDELITQKSTLGEVLGERLTQKLNLHPSISELTTIEAIDYIADELDLQAKCLKAIGRLKNTEAPVPNIDQMVLEWQREKEIDDLWHEQPEFEVPAEPKVPQRRVIPEI